MKADCHECSATLRCRTTETPRRGTTRYGIECQPYPSAFNSSIGVTLRAMNRLRRSKPASSRCQLRAFAAGQPQESKLCSVPAAHDSECLCDVLLDRIDPYEKLLGYLNVGQTTGNKVDDLCLSW